MSLEIFQEYNRSARLPILWIELLEYCLWHWKAQQNVSPSYCTSCSCCSCVTQFICLRLNNDASAATYINIEYLTWPIIRYKREVLFGWVDLLVSFGGIAGLFLGFSLLSGVEIIYYFTMRAICMLYQNKVIKFGYYIRSIPLLCGRVDHKGRTCFNRISGHITRHVRNFPFFNKTHSSHFFVNTP